MLAFSSTYHTAIVFRVQNYTDFSFATIEQHRANTVVVVAMYYTVYTSIDGVRRTVQIPAAH